MVLFVGISICRAGIRNGNLDAVEAEYVHPELRERMLAEALTPVRQEEDSGPPPQPQRPRSPKRVTVDTTVAGDVLNDQ